MNEILRSVTDLYCDLILKGKLCACEAIQERYVTESVDRVKSIYGLMTYVEDLAPGWNTLWIYKDEYMLEIIKLLPEEPKTVYDHWILGKAFGYSDEAIRIFLETKQKNLNAGE